MYVAINVIAFTINAFMNSILPLVTKSACTFLLLVTACRDRNGELM
jgi:hypothetical protein